jgi:hypothetical protein
MHVFRASVIAIIATTFFIATPAISAEKWDFRTKKDQMTGETAYFANSPVISPTKTLGFPYNNVKSRIGIGCKNGSKWMYFAFTDAPNLKDGNIKNNYSEFKVRIKIDDLLTYVWLRQDWGESYLHVSDESRIFDEHIKKHDLISAVSKSSKILLELPWYGVGDAYFSYPLSGASEAVGQQNANCK